MAETVKIEIPVSVTDKTASGVSSIQKRFTSLDKSLEKTQKRLDKLGGGRYKFDLEMEGHASDKIADVEDALQKVHGSEARMSVTASDDATDVINNVSDAAGKLNGEGAVVEAEADDAATGVLSDVDDRLSELNGGSAVVDVEADDAASGVIDEVSGKAAELDGSTITVLLQAEDNITGAIGNAASASRTPIAGAATAMGASFGVYDSLTTFADFESAMSQVKAISGATGAEFDALTTKAKQMGASTKFTATESAEAFNYMAMAGWKTDDMLAGIDGIMNLAAASGESLGTTSDIVTDALTAFGMQASDSTHFADVLAQASANANTNVSMMGESFKYVGPLAGAMGYSIEDTALALGVMANAGVKSSMSGTALRRAITALTSPTEKQANAMEKYGISATKEDGSIKSLNEVMMDLRTNLSGLSEDEKTAAISTMFGSQAMAGMLAIVNASEEDFDKLSTAVNNADGASKRMADTMLDNMQGSFTLMQSAIEGVKNELGERLSPYFRSLADGITAAMPDATKAIEGVMDKVDLLAQKFSNTMKTMINSEEWQNADFLGKIDIAWDTMIVEPFREWAGGEGALAVSNVVTGLFENAFKILPGGEDAGLTSWLSAGILAIAGTKIAGLAESIGTLSTNLIGLAEGGGILGSFAGAIGTAIPWIAGGALAIGGLNLAIDAYNQKKVEKSLADHFGEIDLTAEDIQGLTDKILDANWKVNVEVALNELKGADQVAKDAEEKLKKNDVLEFKASVGVQLTSDETTAYSENVTSFVQSKLSELESRTYSVHLLVGTFLGGTEEGQTLASAIESWTLSDTIEMRGLSDQLTQAVDEALSDGILDVDEQKHISELQNKVNGIMSRWKQAEAKAQADLVNQKYGNMTMEELSGGSFAAMQESLHKQRQLNDEYLDQASKEFYQAVEAMDSSGRLSEIGLDRDTLIGQWDTAIRAERAKGLANSIGSQAGTLANAYGDEMKEWQAESSETAEGIVSRLNDTFQKYGKYDLENTGWSNDYARDLVNSMNEGVRQNASNVDAGLEELYSNMLPDVNDMVSYIDRAFDENGKQLYKIPQEIMDAYTEAMQVGAAAGDYDAGMQIMANEIAKSGDQAMIDAIMAGEFGSSELRSALRRSLAEVGTDMTLDDVTVSIEDAQIAADSASNLKESLKENIGSLISSLNDLNENGGEVVLSNGVTVKVPVGGVELDTSSVVSTLGTGQALLGFETGLFAGATEVLDLGTIPAKADAQVTEVNTEEARQEMEQEVDDTFGEPVEEETPVNDNLNETDNLPEVYSTFEQEVTSMFGNQISVTTPVNITLDWHITNPSASIGVSTNGGSATASISSGGFANGGFVNGAMLSLIGEDGPEYIIPVGSKKRERGAELWAKAGQALGMFEGIPAYADGGLVGEEEKSLQNPFEQRKEADGFFQELFGSEPDKSISTVFAGLPAVAGSPQGVNNTNTNGVNVNVNMSPVIQIDGANLDEEKVFEVMKNRIAEVADDVADEVGMKLVKAYANMPLASGV